MHTTDDSNADGDTADDVESILVGVDGSDTARRALGRALSLAERYDASVSVLSVLDPDGTPMTFDVETVDELEQTKRRLVDDIVAEYDSHTVEVNGTIRRGRPGDVIRRFAENHDVDLIVLGRSSHGPITEALLGSTADRVIRTSSVPVVVVPEAER
ncbi:universal stress protein [Natronosalvus vescus]|uniref:universal stress protein n=1 Tax=Natronosalvus vescus TaxID=2953881 RepID=UPI0020907B6B|nr:universal stress protein [Natronosalvus vescus]